MGDTRDELQTDALAVLAGVVALVLSGVVADMLARVADAARHALIANGVVPPLLVLDKALRDDRRRRCPRGAAGRVARAASRRKLVLGM